METTLDLLGTEKGKNRNFLFDESRKKTLEMTNWLAPRRKRGGGKKGSGALSSR